MSISNWILDHFANAYTSKSTNLIKDLVELTTNKMVSRVLSTDINTYKFSTRGK